MDTEAVEVKTNHKNFLKLVGVSIGHFMNDFYMNLIPPMLFIFTEIMSLSLTQQAVIASIINSSGTFIQPLLGIFVDRHGKPWLLTLSILWISFWMSISGIIHNYYLLLLVLTLAAASSALYHPMGSAAAMSLGTTKKGMSLSIFITIGTLAMMFPPIIAFPIVQKYGLDKLVLFMIPGFIVAGIMYLCKVQDINFPGKADNRGRKEPLKKKTVKWLSFLVAISTNGHFIKTVFITFGVQIMSIKGIEVDIASKVLAGYLFLNAIGALFGGYLNDMFGSKKILIWTNIIATLCIFTMYFASQELFMVAYILIGFILSGSNTANVVMAHDVAPENINFATGLIQGFAHGLGGLIILAYGKFADSYGLLLTTGLLLIPMLLINIITFILPSSGEISSDQINL